MASIGTYTCPTQFRYIPPTPDSRTTVKKTAGSAVVHMADALVGEGVMIDFTIEALSRSEWNTILTAFRTDWTSAKTFTGYWGDVFSVNWIDLHVEKVYQTNFDVAGQMVILSVTSWGTSE